MKKIFKGLIKLSEGKKNIAKISGGTILGQVITFITIPVFTRIYGAEILGMWTFLNSIFSIINSFTDLGMTNAIMLSANNSKVEKLYQVITTIVTFFSILSGILIAFYFTVISPSFNINSIFLAIFCVISIFTLQQIQICYTWLNRNGEYNILMKNPLINGMILGSVGIILGFMGYINYGYFIAVVIAQIATLINMKRYLPKKMFTFRIKDHISLFKENKEYINFQLPTNIINNIRSQIPIILIKNFWGVELLGYYSITVRMLQLPISLLASAIGRVFFSTTSKMKRGGKKIGEYVYKNITSAMKVGSIPIALLMAFGDIVAVILFGKEWNVAGEFVKLLALQYFFMFLSITVQGLSMILDKQKYSMISCICQAIGYILGAMIGKYIFDSISIALVLMSIFFIIINIIYFCMLFKAMELSCIKYLRHVLFYVLLIISIALSLRWATNVLGIVDWIYISLGIM